MSEFDQGLEAEPDAETMLTPLSGSAGTKPRALLVRKLCDIVVLPTGRISSNERALAADILLQVLDKVDVPLRIEVARRIARVAECPPALLRMLLLDEIDVSEVVISSADQIPEALLIEAARDGTPAHRIAIASRVDLSMSVADACLLYDEEAVCKLVMKRTSCNISPNAINRLVALSATKPQLQPLLLRRPELEPAHGFMMFWWVGSEHRKRILARFSLDRAIIQDALEDLYPRVFRTQDEADPFVKDILILSERRYRPRGANGEPVSMDVVKRTLVAAKSYPSNEIIDAVGMIGGITRELAARILRDPGGEPFAVLCKSLGIPREDFFSFFGENGDGETTEEQAEAHLSVFDGMARDFARAVLRYWDWDGNPRIAHITRLLGLVDDDMDESITRY